MKCLRWYKILTISNQHFKLKLTLHLIIINSERDFSKDKQYSRCLCIKYPSETKNSLQITRAFGFSRRMVR
ncbi:hypothetical protein T4B_28 [Trichinella pseudospiralis]|uniref:Uncharacterized protein n=2 Tax=Trichinella pseudospiralis TaxID=6337 RepID=A0A0V1FE86_TRIPS|nr:hypothetical protein T4A_4252 [Trichinella pseudospiralis]KRY84359.1 hypothetical protein T4D_9995 [Trichinella pseudospiralis]KRZ23708.1 hypothetical protein T4B_28 [Trichinella pseudospiralis]KRZ44535.1 hypothetical protein T4C_11521 [Trichinella pseudospiralis]